MAGEKNSIFEFADMFDINSPLGDWLPQTISQSNSEIAQSGIYVTRMDGPISICSGGIYDFKITSFNKANVVLFDVVRSIKWGYSTDGKKITLINQLGKIDTGKKQIVLKWKIPKIDKANYVKVYAWIVKPIEQVSVSSSIIQYPFYFDRYKVKGLDKQAVKIADDLCYGDGVTVTDHFRYTKEDVEALGDLMKDTTMKSAEYNLWTDFKLMVNSLFTSVFYQDLKKTAQSMVDRFKNGHW